MLSLARLKMCTNCAMQHINVEKRYIEIKPSNVALYITASITNNKIPMQMIAYLNYTCQYLNDTIIWEINEQFVIPLNALVKSFP